MSYSDIVGSISGLLQFAVACSALRVSRRFGAARLGWTFFGAFTLLALVHVLLSVGFFGHDLDLSPTVNVMYEVVSILLLGTVAQVELLLWRRRRQEAADLQARAQEELRVKEQIDQLTKANEETKQTSARLQAESAQQIQNLEQAHAAAEKIFQEQLTASHESEAALRDSVAKLEAEVGKQFDLRLQEQAQVAAQAEAEKLLQEQIAALKQSDEEWRTTASTLSAEVTQHKEAFEQAEKSYREQLEVLRQSEELWRSLATRLETELAQRPPIPPPQPEPEPEPEKIEEIPQAVLPPPPPAEDPLTLLRQSGISEIATLTQSRVAYLARIARLMRDHQRNLAKFITRHPQGKLLPDSLSLLIDYMSDEQFLLVKRIDFIKKKFEQNVPSASTPPAPAAESNGAVSVAVEPLNLTDAEPASAPAGQWAGDFRDHLISNVTETGTEMPAPASETPESAEDIRGDILFGSGDPHI